MNITSEHSLINNIRLTYNSEYEKVPPKAELFDWVDHLISVLFPLRLPSEKELEKELENNKLQFNELLKKAEKSQEAAGLLTKEFYSNLPEVFDSLKKDLQKFYTSDPAAKCIGEILHTYPGFYAISIYRIAHIIHSKLKIQYIPRMLSEYAHSKTGIDIHPGAVIEAPFMIDHGTGVVIGETCIIGKDVNIYQGVTLGALQVEKDLQGTKRHPTIEHNVIIYANATVLGGSTIIGNNSIIGGNVFLTKSLDPYSIVYGKPDLIIKKNKENSNIINFTI